ncbi:MULTISPECIES: hypothetical protein [Chryseobacterium]|jgi:hypothetical protein|uniref:Uncharacterized protein n=1 Tax=Chryseobacterium geocarposphaerae TaxID=1416776 RepID=A0ABU1LD07_9FLAO|nr:MULTISPECIES: hypothetical protein [Chryseobacterium]ALR31224.1 hypothetical protein ATE47_12135 [Chryseobacterium sp. IHB B 17019]MDR6404605.1 hypothetical protein [Chryseobacterium geocarposphaerae]MDR6698162.1 hypothetical protein [Chryseobacterium ginsenosidimutans]
MNATTEILKHKIESLTPELLETLVRIVEKLEAQNKFSVPQFQIDEVLYRIEFHNENPKTKLDFYENISELKKYCA